jgi:hypothetical protein
MMTSLEMYNQAVIVKVSLINACELGEELKNFFVWLTNMFIVACIYHNYLKAL